MNCHDLILLSAGLLLAGGCTANGVEEIVEEEQPAPAVGTGGTESVADSGKPGNGGTTVKADAATAPVTDAWTADFGRIPQLGEKDAKGRVLVWAQEFDTPEIDTSAWALMSGHEYNGIQNYATDKEHLFIENGDLVFHATATTSGTTTTYDSAGVETKGVVGWMYGRIEAKIKLSSAAGSWPALWMLPMERGEGWPKSGEIDIMEYVSQDQFAVYGTPHYVKGGVHVSGSQMDHRLVLEDDYAWAKYRVFAIEWTANEMVWYCDDILYNRLVTSSPFDGRRPFNQAFYLINQYAIGGEWPEAPQPGAYPDQMRTDWVRVWQTPSGD